MGVINWWRERRRFKLLRKILRPMMRQAPIEKIARGEGCDWPISDGDSKKVRSALEEYVRHARH